MPFSRVGSSFGSKFMLKLPVYLRKNTFYFHCRIDGRQLKRSLRTSDPLLAKLRALQILRVIEMSKPKIGDFNFGSLALSKYEIDLARGIAKASDEEDHKRLMQALKGMAKASQSPQPAAAVEPLATPPASAGTTLVELCATFFQLKSNLSNATLTDYSATSKEFSQFLKHPPFGEISSDDITSYMKWLSEKGNSARTIDKKVGVVRALFNFAKKQKLFKSENPAADRNLLTKKQKKAAGSKAFDLADVKTLFDNDCFKGLRETNPSFYWIMVIGLITGVRVTALAAIKNSALKVTPEGVHYIYIEDDKTPAGQRPVPVPQSVFTPLSGFLSQASGFGFDSRKDGKGASDPVRKLLEGHKKAINYSGKKQTFHSFRKTLNTFFMHKKVPIEVRCQFLGHEIDHVNVDVYGEKYSIEEINGYVLPLQNQLLELIKF